jgi:hypothetical protein
VFEEDQMVERRNLVGGGLAAGLAALMAGEDAEAAAAQGGGNDTLVAGAINDLREAVNNTYVGPWRAIGLIREQQRIWLRANHRYPDFIEIGIGIWDSLYDWHVRYQQPIGMTRSPDGRYLIAFMFTTFVLRPDQALDYIGAPYDNERRPGQ